LLRRVGFAYDLLGKIQKQFSFLREPELSLGTVYELRTSLLLELGDLCADRALRLVHSSGCEAEAFAVTYRYKSPEKIARNIHLKNK